MNVNTQKSTDFPINLKQTSSVSASLACKLGANRNVERGPRISKD